MVQPALRITTEEDASEAAQSLETPSEIRGFEALGSNSRVVRAFLQTGEWAAIYARIMGDGKPPTGRYQSWADVVRFLRWTGDGGMPDTAVPQRCCRKAYLRAAVEVEAYAQRVRQAAPVSPAVPQAPAAAQASSSSSSWVSFAEALTAVKTGSQISRASWPGGVYVVMQAGYPQGIGINANTAAATGLIEGSVMEFPPYLLRVTPSPGAGMPPSGGPWSPADDDLFANDWRILAGRIVVADPVNRTGVRA